MPVADLSHPLEKIYWNGDSSPSCRSLAPPILPWSVGLFYVPHAVAGRAPIRPGAILASLSWAGAYGAVVPTMTVER